jgi:hypothetical protein
MAVERTQELVSARLAWREWRNLGGQIVSPALDSAEEAGRWRFENPGIVGHGPLTLCCVLADGTESPAPDSDSAMAILVFARLMVSCDCPYCERVRKPM